MLTLRGFYRCVSPIFHLFQLFGLFPIDLTSKYNSRANQLIRFYSVVLAIITLIVAVFIFRFRLKVSNVHVNVLIDQAMWMAMCVAHFVTCIEVLVTMPRQVHFVRNMHLVTQIFSRRLMRNLDVEAIRRVCVCCSWISFMTIVFVISVSVLVISETSWMDFRWIALSWCAIQVRLIQVTTYVRFVNALLNELALELVRIRTIVDTGKRCSMLEDCMQIYSVLGDSVTQVNALFGWSVMAIFAQNLCGITNTCYWIVYNVYYMQRFTLSVCKLCKIPADGDSDSDIES